MKDINDIIHASPADLTHEEMIQRAKYFLEPGFKKTEVLSFVGKNKDLAGNWLLLFECIMNSKKDFLSIIECQHLLGFGSKDYTYKRMNLFVTNGVIEKKKLQIKTKNGVRPVVFYLPNIKSKIKVCYISAKIRLKMFKSGMREPNPKLTSLFAEEYNEKYKQKVEDTLKRDNR